MQYRVHGKSGKRVSALGFGAMRLPEDEDLAAECMVRAVNLGVNYIDTAYAYGDGWNERIVGRALQHVDRDSVYISTKIPFDDETKDSWWRRAERSLKMLGTDRIDFMKVVHSVTWDIWQQFDRPGGPIEAAQEAKDQGIFDHWMFSSHDTAENIVKLIDTGRFEGMLVQYNILDRRNEDVIAYAADQGLAVEIMGPVAGGRLAHAPDRNDVLPPGTTVPELALRFVLSNPDVTLALSGMNTLQQVDENCATADRTDPLSEREREAIAAIREESRGLNELYCTGCGYCMPCPQNVGIPQIFEAKNMYSVWGMPDKARRMYAELGPDNDDGLLQADACVECGVCLAKCPQNIAIPDQLTEAHKVLSKDE